MAALAAALLGHGQGAARLVPHLPAGKRARGSSSCSCRGAAGIASSSRTSRRSFPSVSSARACASLWSSTCWSSPSSSPRAALEVEPTGLAGDESAPRAGLGARAARAARLSQRRRPARHPLEEDRRRPAPWSSWSARARRAVGSRSSSTTPPAASAMRRPNSRFEHLVSEAATAAVDHLARGYEVELVTRDGTLPFGVGARHRQAILREPGAGRAAAAPAHRAASSDPGALPADRLRRGRA